MSKTEEHIARIRVIAEARRWIGTPYHTMGRVRGIGADCLTFIAEVFTAAGVIERPEIPYYQHDFMLHRSGERYLEGLMRYGREVDAPKAGDIAIWKFGRCFSHAAIVMAWPTIIHAYVGRSVMLENAEAARWLSHVGETGKARPRKFLSHWV